MKQLKTTTSVDELRCVSPHKPIWDYTSTQSYLPPDTHENILP